MIKLQQPCCTAPQIHLAIFEVLAYSIDLLQSIEQSYSMLNPPMTLLPKAWLHKYKYQRLQLHKVQ